MSKKDDTDRSIWRLRSVPILEVSSVPDREEPRCPYCLGAGKLPKVVLAIAPEPPLALPVQWQTCMGCGGSGQLKADDWQVRDGGGW
jgi:hypothetical protein